MDFAKIDLNPQQQTVLDEVRALLAEIITPEVHAHERETGAGFNEDVHLAMGSCGWLYPDWPVEAGGAGLDPIACKLIELELERHEVPWITQGTTRVAWTAVERFGDPELAAELKPEVAAGRVRFCLGYTDPEGGSDIAAAHLKAVRDGDSWVLDGAKMFTTGAQHCQYTFLLTRTDPAQPKHKGLTMFLVPLDTPGIEIQAIHTFGGERTNAVYYSGARIPDRYRLGEVNGGWAVLRGPLDAEHGDGDDDGLGIKGQGPGYVAEFGRAIDAAAAWARATTRPDGTPVAEDPVFLDRLGEQIVQFEAATVTPGPMNRVKTSLALIAGAGDLVDLVGAEALLAHGADGAIANGRLDRSHRWAQGTATYGGTVEVFRNIIAEHVLGLPRASLPGSKALVR